MKEFEDRLLKTLTGDKAALSLEAAMIAVKLWPGDAFWEVQLGAALETVGRWTEAESWLLSAYPTGLRIDRELNGCSGMFAKRRVGWLKPKTWFRKATETAPDKTAVWIYLGSFLARHERFAEACEVLHLGIDAEGDRDEVYLNLAMSQRTLGALEAAMKSLQKAIEICPDYPEAAHQIADLTAALSLRQEYQQTN